MISPFFTTKFLRVFSLAAVLTLGVIQQSFGAAAYDDEDDLPPIERNVLGLYCARCLLKTPYEAGAYTRRMQTGGWSLVKMSHLDYGVQSHDHKVIIAQNLSSCSKVTPHEIESSPFIEIKNLRKYLGFVEREDYVEFVSRNHLDVRMPTVPSIVADTYLGVEKEYLEGLINTKSGYHFAIAGGPTTSLIATTIKILAPHSRVNLIMFGYVPPYTKSFLSSIGVNYTVKSHITKGYPMFTKGFEKDFCSIK